MCVIWGDLHRPNWENVFALVTGLLGEFQGTPWGSVGENPREWLICAGQSCEGGFPNPALAAPRKLELPVYARR